MSQLSSAIDALEKTGDVGVFVQTIAVDIQKDFQAISALPGVQAFETWLVNEFQTLLSKVKIGTGGISQTLIDLIIAAIQDAL